MDFCVNLFVLIGVPAILKIGSYHHGVNYVVVIAMSISF